MRRDLSPYRRLTPSKRELQVLAHVLVSGRKGAAYSLSVSERTITHHLTSIYNLLGAMNQTEAAALLGWLTIPPEYGAGASVPFAPVPSSERAERLAETVIHYLDGLLNTTGSV